MKITVWTAFVAAIAIIVPVTPAVADGIIHELPPDGSWVRFDTTGGARKPDGTLAVSLKGRMTLRSVGSETIDATACRWIEIETTTEFQRGDEKGEVTEIYKLLISEKHLASYENPRAHVLKAWRKDAKGVVGELNMRGDGAKAVERLDELFHARFSKSEKQEGVENKTPARNFRCTKVDAHEAAEPANVEISTQTWLTSDVPFGIAAYRHSKARKRDGVSLGERWLELKVAEVGKDAKSALGQ
jgi:hypothetical protein